MKRKQILKKAAKPIIFSGLIIISFAVAIMLLTANTEDVIVIQVIEQRRWQPVPLGEDANPGTGASGVLNVSIVANGHFDYESNMTYNSSFYATGITNNSHIGSNVPYDTAFDIVIKVRWNQTHCFNSSGTGQYMLDWVRGNITCAGLSISADTPMDEFNISGCDTTTFIWVHYVANNSGAGYTISRGQNITSMPTTYDAYFA